MKKYQYVVALRNVCGNPKILDRYAENEYEKALAHFNRISSNFGEDETVVKYNYTMKGGIYVLAKIPENYNLYNKFFEK